MYKSKLVAAIKSNGKVLREFSDKVYIPFSSEYSILIKNLNTLRALVDIEIDGQVAVKGLIVDAKSEIELERFVGKNLNEGNRFKFIEKSDKISEHRGNKLEDGIVVISYRFEAISCVTTRTSSSQYPYPVWVDHQHYHHSHSHWGNPMVGGDGTDSSHSLRCTSFVSDSVPVAGNTEKEVNTSSVKCNYSADVKMSKSGTLRSRQFGETTKAAYVNDSGITVPGSKSNQKFNAVSGFVASPEEFTITLNLLGETEDNKKVRTAVTTKAKIECVTCGTKNKATSKFCKECGTAVHVIA